MYDRERVIPEFRSIVRFKQTVAPDIEILPDSLTTPTSARIIDHPLITTEVIDPTTFNFDQALYPIWDIATNYVIGDIVRASDENIYTALTDNVGLDPISSPTDWEIIEPLARFLTEKRDIAIDEMLSDFVRMKKLRGDSKTLLNKLSLFTGAARIDDKIVKQSRIVGFEINLIKHSSIKMIIEQIGFQADTAQILPMYLYHSGRLNPIAQYDVNISGDYDFEWTPLTEDNVIYFDDNELDSTGKYYLVYFEDDLIGQAYTKRHNFGTKPCAACSRYNMDAYRKYTNFFTIQTISVSQQNQNQVDPRLMWDNRLVIYEQNTNFGMNLRVSSRCDISETLILNADLFADALDKKLTVMLLEEQAYSLRQNDYETRAMKMAFTDLQIEKNGGSNPREEYKYALKAVDFDLSDLSDLCLPCNNRGIKISSVSV